MIFNYQDIINEWFALLPKGYATPPYSVTETQLLKEVLKRYGFSSTETFFEPHLFELSNKDIDDDGRRDDMGDRVRIEGVKFMHSPELFTKFIYDNYVHLGETVQNLDGLYNSLKRLPKEVYSDIVKLIGGNSKRKLSYGTYKIGKFEGLLLKMINKYIRLKSGHQIQLWFSIIHDGKIKAAVSNATDGINSDVVKNDIGISIKKFDSSRVVDFGILPPELVGQLKSLIGIFTALMDQQVDTSRESLNDLFLKLSDPSTIEDIRKLIATSKDTNVASISKLGAKMEAILNGAPPDEFIANFCLNIDNLIASKLREVDYWGCVIDEMVILQKSTDIYDKIKSKDNKISKAIISFDGYHLWVSSGVLYNEEEQQQERDPERELEGHE